MPTSKILVAHDFSEAANRALRFARDVAEQTHAELALLYVHPDIYDGRSDPSLSLPNTLPGQPERYLHFLEQELKQVAEKVLGSNAAKLRCYAVRGDPVKQIEALAQELGATIICLGATGKGAVERVILGSVSQLVLRTSAVPVLLVP